MRTLAGCALMDHSWVEGNRGRVRSPLLSHLPPQPSSLLYICLIVPADVFCSVHSVHPEGPPGRSSPDRGPRCWKGTVLQRPAQAILEPHPERPVCQALRVAFWVISNLSP